MSQVTLLILVLIAVIAVGLLSFSIVITRPKQYQFIVFLGKYWFTAKPGLSFKVPFLSWADKSTYVGVSEQSVPLQLKTADQVTFNITLKVLYQVSEDVNLAFKAVYDLEDFVDQITTMATDAAIPVANKVELEDVYDAKEKITAAAHEALVNFFADYGIQIHKVLSDEPRLPAELENEANAVLAAKRKKEAAVYKADAIKTEKIGEAEADGESVKIRMDKLGEARRAYAQTAADAVKTLVDAGCSHDSALSFLNKVGEQDSVVSASRHGGTIVFTSQSSQSSLPETAGMIEALKGVESSSPVKQTKTKTAA